MVATPYIDQIKDIHESNKKMPKKQRHTAKRIFERLRDEHGFAGRLTIVTDYVRERKRRTREVFVPLAHPRWQNATMEPEGLGSSW